VLLKCDISIFSCFHAFKVTRISADSMQVFSMRGNVPVVSEVYGSWSSELTWSKKGYKP